VSFIEVVLVYPGGPHCTQKQSVKLNFSIHVCHSGNALCALPVGTKRDPECLHGTMDLLKLLQSTPNL
jgi:hypothetical protein